VFLLVMFSEMLRVAIVAIIRGKDGAWIIGLGFIALFAGVSGFALKIAGILGHSGDGPVLYHYYGVLGLLASMSVYLARSFGRTNQELQEQLAEVKALSTRALEQERRIRDEEVQRTLLEEELQTAHDLQMGLMPSESPQVPGLSVAGRCVPSNHVGGDFFQYFTPDGKLTAVMADVTGHAMDAAVPVMMFSGVLDHQMETPASVEEHVRRLNASMHRALVTRTFVCFTMGEIDADSRILRLSNAACPYPYHFQASAGQASQLAVGGYPLGVRPDTEYEVLEVQLEPGDRVVFCSDGIVEANDAADEQFGYERTADAIRQACGDGLSAEATIDSLLEQVAAFKGDTPQSDDMACVVVHVEEDNRE